jgi:hypothetical protein
MVSADLYGKVFMKLKIDFYSKEKMGILFDLSKDKPFSDNSANELFMFICFTLRQLSNLGQRPDPVPQALAGLLVSKEKIKTFLEEAKLPPGKDLLSNLKTYASVRLSKDKSIQEILRISDALDVEFKHSSATINALDKVVISIIPRIIKPKGDGKRYFEATFPPFLLNTKGFGIFGTDIPHHAFHSVAGLIRVLEFKNKRNQKYIEYLIQTAEYCGAAYIFKKISYDHADMAYSIIKDLKISSNN